MNYVPVADQIWRYVLSLVKSMFIPNTAVFGPTKLIGTTTIASTRMMKISTVAGRGH